jgi:hypothetical protein
MATTNRLDRIVAELEELQSNAQDIIDAYVDSLAGRYPEGTGFGEIKRREIAEPAGLVLDIVAALKLVKERLTCT